MQERDKINFFKARVGINDDNIARNYLNLTNGNKEQAVQLYVSEQRSNLNLGANNFQNPREISGPTDFLINQDLFSKKVYQLNEASSYSDLNKFLNDMLIYVAIDFQTFFNNLKKHAGLIIILNKQTIFNVRNNIICACNNQLCQDIIKNAVIFPVMNDSQLGTEFSKIYKPRNYPLYLFCKYKNSRIMEIKFKAEYNFVIDNVVNNLLDCFPDSDVRQSLYQSINKTIADLRHSINFGGNIDNFYNANNNMHNNGGNNNRNNNNSNNYNNANNNGANLLRDYGNYFSGSMEELLALISNLESNINQQNNNNGINNNNNSNNNNYNNANNYNYNLPRQDNNNISQNLNNIHNSNLNNSNNNQNYIYESYNNHENGYNYQSDIYNSNINNNINNPHQNNNNNYYYNPNQDINRGMDNINIPNQNINSNNNSINIPKDSINNNINNPYPNNNSSINDNNSLNQSNNKLQDSIYGLSDGEVNMKREREMRELEKQQEEKIRKEEEEKRKKLDEENEKKKKIENYEKEALICKQNLPNEPEESNPDVCRIMFRYPDGDKNSERRFLKTDKINILYTFVKSLGREIFSEPKSNNFDLFTGFPAKNLENSKNNTLESEGLFPSSMVQIREKE